MTRSIKAAPPYSVVVLEDAGGGEVPGTMGSGGVAATESCIAIGTLAEVDGETAFTLGAARDVDPGWAPSFQGTLPTPSGKLVLRTVLDKILLEREVANARTAIRIWLNDAREPDRVLIGVE